MSSYRQCQSLYFFYTLQTFFNEFYRVGNFLENDENINLPSFDRLVDKVYPGAAWRVLVKRITRECHREVEQVDTPAARSDPCKRKIFQFDDCLVANIVIVSSLIFQWDTLNIIKYKIPQQCIQPTISTECHQLTRFYENCRNDTEAMSNYYKTLWFHFNRVIKKDHDISIISVQLFSVYEFLLLSIRSSFQY